MYPPVALVMRPSFLTSLVVLPVPRLKLNMPLLKLLSLMSIVEPTIPPTLTWAP